MSDLRQHFGTLAAARQMHVTHQKRRLWCQPTTGLRFKRVKIALAPERSPQAKPGPGLGVARTLEEHSAAPGPLN